MKRSTAAAGDRLTAKFIAVTVCFCAAFSGLGVAAAECGIVDPQPGFESSYAEGWGIDKRNTRYQPRSTIDSSNVGKLSLKWAYGLASVSPRSYPLVTEDTIFLGDGGRGLVALERETGCERWVYEHEGPISSAILQGWIGERRILIFNDRNDGMIAIDAIDGEFIWQAAVEDEPAAWYSGSPLILGETVILPVSSKEVTFAMNPLYGCCVSSGGMAAFDINTGEKLWYIPTIEKVAKPTERHWLFVQEYGPSGAPVWAAPSYDAKRGLIFFGTGQNYSHPTTDTSDSIFAVDVKTGKVRWIRQFTANDAYTAACNLEALNHPNCAKPTGPDLDFGAATMFVRGKSGRELVIGGQKSSEAHAMDPATGEVVWTTRLGRGGIIGGVHWGMAANEKLGLIYVPISDKKLVGFPAPGEPTPGLYALDIDTGERRWEHSRDSRCPDMECVFGISAAIIASNDIVVAGNMDGILEVLAAESGKLLWSHDSWRDYPSVNNVATTGGSFDAHGSMIADDLLLVNSGYRYVGQQRGGNAFLVFQVEANDEQ
ncbi:MAG: PQQ-binding-like beta-propeller repeat protein [Pseudomonadales bacterium]|jgi:polyvinyl alcohol dehydrogenase (cytochrome)